MVVMFIFHTLYIAIKFAAIRIVFLYWFFTFSLQIVGTCKQPTFSLLPITFKGNIENVSHFQVPTTSRVNINNQRRNSRIFSEFEFDNFTEYNFSYHNNFEIIRYIDQGRFSTVYKGLNAVSNDYVILKVLKPIMLKKIIREVKVLQIVKGISGVIELYDICKQNDVISLVFEFLGDDGQWLSHKVSSELTSDELRLYFLKLLLAINSCHSIGVMHRDLKPRNIIINRNTEQLRIIDFGLSDIYFPKKIYNTNVASRFFKSPELLCGYNYYDFAIDIWSIGCMFAGLIFLREPFFSKSFQSKNRKKYYDSNNNNNNSINSNEKDTADQLKFISSILGSNNFYKWTEKFNIPVTGEMKDSIGKYPPIPLHTFRNNLNCHLCCDDAIDLLSKMLIIDHQHRITANECISHIYFDPVRHLIK